MSDKIDQNNDALPMIQSLLYDAPLMIAPAKADIIHQVLQGKLMGQVADIQGASEFMQTADRKPYAVTAKGVAVIPVMGALVHRGGFLDAMSGITSYQRLSRMLHAAAKDNDVKGILLEVDSPGGSVSGLYELTNDIAKVNAQKPIWSLSNEGMFSAAYAIGAATSRIIAPRTAMAGSIGVIMMHLDNSKANDKAGRKYTPIYAGHHKIDGSSHAPLSEQARQTYEHIVQDAYGIFVEHVAEGRGMEQQAVIDTQANIFTAPDALDNGLIDEIASFDETLLALESHIASSTSFSLASSSSTTEVTTMSKDNQPEGATFTQADLDAATKIGIEQGTTAGIEKGQTTERARVTAILGHGKASANFAQASNAISTGLTADQAKGVLDAMPEAAQANDFLDRMGKGNNPDVSADGADSSDLTATQLADTVIAGL